VVIARRKRTTRAVTEIRMNQCCHAVDPTASGFRVENEGGEGKGFGGTARRLVRR
jgi:hypothetical protein